MSCYDAQNKIGWGYDADFLEVMAIISFFVNLEHEDLELLVDDNDMWVKWDTWYKFIRLTWQNLIFHYYKRFNRPFSYQIIIYLLNDHKISVSIHLEKEYKGKNQKKKDHLKNKCLDRRWSSSKWSIHM